MALGTTFLVLLRSFKKEKSEVDMSVDQMKRLEEILKSHLSQTPAPTATPPASLGAAAASAAPAPGGPSGVPPAEVEAMMKEKEGLIGQLNQKIQQLEAAAKANPQSDSKEWETKIGELKARLSEYEIIADDIANLSFYKTENARLKDELSKMGGAAPQAAAAAAPEPVAATPAPAPVAPPPEPPPTAPAQPQAADNLEALMAALDKADVGTNTVPPAPVPDVEKKTENVMQDFEAAVKQKNALEDAAKKVQDKMKPSNLAMDEDEMKAAPEFSQEAVQAAAQKKDDIVAEFSAAVAGEAPQSGAAPGFQAMSVDSEKLLNEINDMAAKPVEPAAAKPEGEEPVDENKKLISEFEAFVKGSGS